MKVQIFIKTTDSRHMRTAVCLWSSRGVGGRTGSYLFEGELKLGRVQQQLEEHPGLVLGVRHHLVLDLTQTLVVHVVRFKQNMW